MDGAEAGVRAVDRIHGIDYPLGLVGHRPSVREFS